MGWIHGGESGTFGDVHERPSTNLDHSEIDKFGERSKKLTELARKDNNNPELYREMARLQIEKIKVLANSGRTFDRELREARGKFNQAYDTARLLTKIEEQKLMAKPLLLEWADFEDNCSEIYETLIAKMSENTNISIHQLHSDYEDDIESHKKKAEELRAKAEGLQ